MGETSIFGLKIVFKRLLGCLATLLSPFIYICRYICDCCCGWCFGNPISRLEKTRDAKVRSFMPSRGPLASSSSSDEDSSSDEVNVFIKEERKPKKFVTFALDGDVKAEILDKKSANEETVDVISVDQKEISPKTDISGRFTSSQPVKILRDSGHGASDFNQQKVLYPSCRSPQLNSQEIASNAVYTSSTTERPGCTIRATQSNAADSISKISTCKSTSHQPPYTQERSLPCLHPNSSNADRKHRPVRAASKSLERPSLPPHLNSRISRTPPPIETPRSSSSAEAIAPSRIHRVSVSSCSSNSSDNSKSSSIGQQRGNTSNSDMSALERTKEYFRQEKQQMNDLLRVWEARTRPRKMIVDVRGRSRSREWLSHQRNRRRELCLQQEERFSTTSRARANGTAHTLSTDSHNIPLPRAASQGSVTVGNRLEMPRMQEPSQWSRSKTSTARSPMPSAKIQSQPPSSEDQDTKPQNIQQKIIQSAAQRLSHASGSYSMESDSSDVSISSLPPSSSGLSNDGKTSVSISLSTSNTSIDQKEYLNQTNNDKKHNIPSADKPTTSNCVTISNSKCSLRTREHDDSHAVTSRNSPNPCSLSPPVLPNRTLSVVENSMWKKLESTVSHQGKEATHRPTYPLTISKNDSITSPIPKRKQSVEDAESNPSGFNISNKLDKTTSEPGMNISKHCYVSTRATAVSTNSKCSNDEASFCNGIDRSIPLPSNSSGNSKVPSKSPIPKHSNIFKLTSHGVDLAVKPVMADSRTRPSESTIIEIPECLISDVSRAPATNSSYCFPQENFENENRKPVSVSFNPFKKWKKHRKGGIALKNSLKPYDKNCTERDCSLSMENECAASIQAKKRDNEEGNLKKKVNKPVMVPKICLYDEKAKSRKFDQRSNDKACKSSPSGKGHHGIHVPTCKPNISPKKTTKRYTVGLKSLAKDPAKDVICPSGFRVENNHIRNRVRSGKSARRKSSSSTTPQARRVGNTEPTFHGIPQCNDLLKMKSSGNIENSSVSSTTNNSQRRYSSSCTVASDAKAQSKQNQGSPLTSETQSSPPQSPLSVVIPPLSFSETSSSNGDNEYLSVPTSPNEQQFLSEMDDFSRNNIPPVGSPRYYTLYPSIYKKQPPDRPQQSLTPRTALDTAVSAFLHEGDYESFSSSDDNDDFWRVSL